MAEKASQIDEVPVGALVVNETDEIIGTGYNQKESKGLATAHAEILAIEQACHNLKSWRLSQCTLYVTLEPCPMCAGAIWASQIKNVVFGAYDKKTGYVSSLYKMGEDQRLNHRFTAEGGILEAECSQILKDYFKKLRNRN